MRSKQILSIIVLANTIGLASVCWAVSPINTVNNGRIIQGGTYYNTFDNKTTFINRGPGGLWLKAGTTVRGLEASANGTLSNNGGTLHLYAPDNVVRIDGNINVNGVLSRNGSPLGNGGSVYIDSAYLFQNGNIFANGINGGLVQVNVGGMTLGNGAQIQAKGSTGAGGVVAINTSGPVDLRRSSVIDTSGKMVGSFDTNLINIEGSLINHDGSLRANGIAAGSRGGTIRLVATGQSDIQDLKDSLQSATVGSDPTISNQERTFLLQRNAALISNHDGDVVLSRDTQPNSFVSNLSANGTSGQIDANNDMTQHHGNRSGDGGTILIAAMDDVVNQGTVFANGARGSSSTPSGGDGGTISLLAQGSILNSHGRMEANGGAGGNGSQGGNGGLIAFGYNGGMTNTGNLYADGGIGGSGSTAGHGGNGGLVVLSGDSNPTGNGSIDVIGRLGGNNNLNMGGQAGTIVSPNPSILGQTQVYFQQGYVNGQLVRTRAVQQTQPIELLTHAENLILLTKNGGNISVAENLFDRMLQTGIRSVEDPTGALGQARTEVINKNTMSSAYVYRNLVLGSSRDNLSMALSHPYYIPGPGQPAELLFPSPLSKCQAFRTLNTLTIVNDGSLSTQILPGPESDSPNRFTDFWVIGRNSNGPGGGRFSALSNGDMFNPGLIGVAGNPIGTIDTRNSSGSITIAATGTIRNDGNISTGGTGHGGSILLKAGTDIFFKPMDEYSILADVGAAGIGGTMRILPKHDFVYDSGSRVSFIWSNSDLQGGIININAGRNSIIYAPNHGIESGTIIADGFMGRGGYVKIQAANQNIHNTTIDVSGSVENGTVVFKTGN